MFMDPLDIRDDLRNFLNSEGVNLADIERSTTMNRSWLSKFRRGEITNPTIEQLNALHRYREIVRAGAT
jgi:transcriptional regulator with XRE-family HTH domain